MASSEKGSAVKRFFLIFIPGIILAFAAILYVTWYSHAVEGESPYDEMFITVNQIMPESARVWACDKIAERFPGTLPPYSC